MSTTQPVPQPGAIDTAAPEPGAESAGTQALVAVAPAEPEPELDENEAPHLSAPIARLPVELDVTVPVRNFRVRNLLALEPGHVIETQWANGEDMPLATGGLQLAWSEFEVIDTELAVRVTRLV